jgi:dTMP kinase
LNSEQGWLIAFEGIDGAGKSTQVELLAAALRREGHTVVTTREPTDGPHGAKIRKLSSQGTAISLQDELDCFLEDRKEHVRELIAPALARGDVVITDRYYLSNVAYQGARGLSPAAILERNEGLFPLPTAAVLLEASASLGLGRVRARGESLNRAYEREDFLTQVAEIYAEIERPYLVRVPVVGTPEEVHRAIVLGLEPLLGADLKWPPESAG